MLNKKCSIYLFFVVEFSDNKINDVKTEHELKQPSQRFAEQVSNKLRPSSKA